MRSWFRRDYINFHKSDGLTSSSEDLSWSPVIRTGLQVVVATPRNAPVYFQCPFANLRFNLGAKSVSLKLADTRLSGSFKFKSNRRLNIRKFVAAVLWFGPLKRNFSENLWRNNHLFSARPGICIHMLHRK